MNWAVGDRGNSSDVLESSKFKFLGHIYYKRYHLGRNFQEQLPTGSLDCVVYNSWQINCCVTINLDNQILGKFPDING